MKKVILTLIFSIITIYIVAQEKKTYWDNGNLKSISNYDDAGKKNGDWKNYFQDGKLKASETYANGKETGTWKEYYYNGSIKRFRGFNDGFQFVETTYFINGKTMVSGNFDAQEKKHGNWEQYYENGQLKLEGEYANGEKNETWKYYTVYGNIYKIENYKSGTKMSKWEGTYNNTKIVTQSVKNVRSYRSEKLNGEWKFYNDAGNCIEIGNYKDNLKDGEWNYYYDNEKLKKTQLWSNGKLLEITSSFDAKGISLDRGTLKGGNGTVKEYDSESTVTIVEYANGIQLDWNDYSMLNSLAWNAYENESDKEILAKAITWAKRSIELDRNYYNTDTYAALEYKMGNYKKALELANEAIEMAIKDQIEFTTTTKLIEEITTKIEK